MNEFFAQKHKWNTYTQIDDRIDFYRLKLQSSVKVLVRVTLKLKLNAVYVNVSIEFEI